MNLLELALESTEKHGWCANVWFDELTQRSCAQGHIARAHGHVGGDAIEQATVSVYDDSCPDCLLAIKALHEAGACSGSCGQGNWYDTCARIWNDCLEMPRDEALYRYTLLRGAKLLDEVQS